MSKKTFSKKTDTYSTERVAAERNDTRSTDAHSDSSVHTELDTSTTNHSLGSESIFTRKSRVRCTVVNIEGIRVARLVNHHHQHRDIHTCIWPVYLTMWESVYELCTSSCSTLLSRPVSVARRER